ncbi:P-loop containing nucleoside triphosphate hydrolase protein [Echria macrotheca]|uniref:ATP-dependent RNA helicase n=1 Tax=Echria macrotheca TaxID=438768 RepID=A0AAJ0BK68_9PEZI|nr:P-loop containing nucleoside triphosphate hydrolase protein [Echria macrotheca]
MMKTSVLRQARFCRAALSGLGRVQIVSRPSLSSSLALSSASRPLATPCLSAASQLLRSYSSEVEARAPERQHKLITKFKDLESLGVNPVLVDAITNGMRFEDMTDVQTKTINAALDGTDLVAQAKTGTGKTLAFLVPILQRILDRSPELASSNGFGRARSDDIRAIIITPTRELAEQIAEEARRLVRQTGIVVQSAVGGTQKRLMLQKTQRQGCHLLIATPGRLLDLLSDPSSKMAAPNLQALVLDEADRMLETGFEQELNNILRELPPPNKVPRQTLLFSATIPKDVVSLARNFVDENKFEFVQTIDPNEAATHEKVPQYIVPCKGMENLMPTLLELIQRQINKAEDGLPFKAIVFLPTTASVVLMKSLFRRIAYQNPGWPQVLDIHSKLTQAGRTVSARDFKLAKSAILFSSDVTARGMDFPNVSHVIQVHLPKDREHYIHRVGRTGRAGKDGEGWILLTDMEVSLARGRLRGLPIQRSTDLECASVDATESGAQLPEQFSQIRKAMEKIPDMIKDEMYKSLLGGALGGNDSEDIVENANNLALITFGYDQPPAVSPKMAQSLGTKNLRVLSRGSEYPPAHGRTGGHMGGGRGGGGFERGRGGGFDRGSAFDRVFNSARGGRDGRDGRDDRGGERKFSRPRSSF